MSLREKLLPNKSTLREKNYLPCLWSHNFRQSFSVICEKLQFWDSFLLKIEIRQKLERIVCFYEKKIF